MVFELDGRMTEERLNEFAELVQGISRKIGFKVSARGWCYQLEMEGMITKAEFDKVESWINTCRERGILPIDFTAEEEGRQFSGVEEPTEESPIVHMRSWVEAAMQSERYYTPDWWDGEKYYIQMVVEKFDLKTLFEPVCSQYHIPIATSKGWSSMLQRATYSRRFAKAEKKGLQPVLLYCGDHDPDGLRISEFLRKNLGDLKDIVWEDGTEGYNPRTSERGGLIIERFGLNYDFIQRHKLSWIPNLITGSKKNLNLADASHKNHKMPYVQEYIKTFGVRKCEANAIVPMPRIAQALVTSAIEEYLGTDSLERFRLKKDKINRIVRDFRKKTGMAETMQKVLKEIDKETEGDDE